MPLIKMKGPNAQAILDGFHKSYKFVGFMRFMRGLVRTQP